MFSNIFKTLTNLVASDDLTIGQDLSVGGDLTISGDITSVGDDVTIGDDLLLNTDSSIIKFGSDSYTYLQHINAANDGNTEGLTLTTLIAEGSEALVNTAFTLKYMSAEAPSAGCGVGMDMGITTAIGLANPETLVRLEAVSTNVGSGTEVGDLVIKTMTGGSAPDEALRIKGNNDIAGQGIFTGKFHHFVHAGGILSDANTAFLDLRPGNIDGANADNNYRRIVTPFAGYISFVNLRAQAAAGSTAMQLYKITDGTDADDVDGTTLGSAVTVDMSSADTNYKFTFGSTYSFAAGDVLAISVNPTNTPNDADGVITFIYTTS